MDHSLKDLENDVLPLSNSILSSLSTIAAASSASDAAGTPSIPSASSSSTGTSGGAGITPKFTIQQDNESVTVILHVPKSLRLGKLTWSVSPPGYELSIKCKPYALNLTFPGLLVGDEDDDQGEGDGLRPFASIEQESISLKLYKKIPGEHFKGLDMISLLRKFGNSTQHIFGIEDLTQNSNSTGISEDSGIPRYGFNNAFSGAFTKIIEEYPETIELKQPDITPKNIRKSLKECDEENCWDEERFLADLFEGAEDPLYLEAIAITKPFCGVLDQSRDGNGIGDSDDDFATIPKNMNNINSNGKNQPFVFGSSVNANANGSSMQHITNDIVYEFDDRERMELVEIPTRNIPRECLIAEGEDIRPQAIPIICAILDILLALAYEQRITNGDGNIESAWTIKILSPLLSWLDAKDESPDFKTAVSDTCDDFVHRVLCKPYMRRYDLASKCVDDVLTIVRNEQSSKIAIIKCLLQVRRTFKHHDCDYIFNRLWLDPLIIWCQANHEGTFDRALKNELDGWLSRKSKGNWHKGIRWDVQELVNDASISLSSLSIAQ